MKGEITLLLGRGTKAVATEVPAEDEVRAIEAQGVSRMDAVKRVAKARGIPKRELYRRVISQRVT